MATWLGSAKCLFNTALAVMQRDGAHSGQDGMPDSLAARIEAATGRLHQAEMELHTSQGAAAEEDLDALLRERSMQPAAELAGLMQQYLDQPRCEAERRLAVARTAARRACAYLGCTNVEGEGGAVAGQGAGSKRCRCAGWLGPAGRPADMDSSALPLLLLLLLQVRRPPLLSLPLACG